NLNQNFATVVLMAPLDTSPHTPSWQALLALAGPLVSLFQELMLHTLAYFVSNRKQIVQ
ncbi:hypothetical protein BgiMline_012029, partial [Biomphalaria glabrata]